MRARASEQASERERERTRARERECERKRACYPRPISGTARPRAQEHRCRAGAVCSAVVTARFLQGILLSHASHACDHTHPPIHTHTLQTIEATGQIPTPPACSTPLNHREVLRRSSGAARKDSCTACERTAFTPCRRTPSAVDTRRRWREEPTSTWPNRRQARRTRCTLAPSTPPPAPARAASTMVEAPHHAARGTPMPGSSVVTFLVSHEPGPSTNPICCIETEEWLSFIAVKSTVVLLRVRRKWQYEIRRGLCSGGFDART